MLMHLSTAADRAADQNPSDFAPHRRSNAIHALVGGHFDGDADLPTKGLDLVQCLGQIDRLETLCRAPAAIASDQIPHLSLATLSR